MTRSWPRLAARLALACGGGAILVGATAGPAAAHGIELGSTVPRPAFPGVLLDWHVDPMVVLPLVAAAALYLRGVRRARERDRSWPKTRTAWFLAGLVVLEIALQSALDTYDVVLFSVHAAQHMLLTVVAAPMLVLGAPMSLLLLTGPRTLRQRVVGIVHSPPVRVLGHPLLAWIVFTVTLYGLYFSPLFDLSLRNELVHKLVHVHFLASGLLFWWPIVARDPSRWRLHPLGRLGMLFLNVPYHAFLGVAILYGNRLLAPTLADFDRSWGPSPLEDQRLGGGLLWGMGEVVALAGILGVLVAWVNYDQKEARRVDRRLAQTRAAQPNGSSLVKRASAGESAPALPQAPPPPANSDAARGVSGNGHEG
jgi:cytochrome c oxidase assembly factor CtaG